MGVLCCSSNFLENDMQDKLCRAAVSTTYFIIALLFVNGNYLFRAYNI